MDVGKSYWECECVFPPTATPISVVLPGDESGPFAEARAIYLAVIEEFDELVARALPAIGKAYREWTGRALSENVRDDLELSGLAIDSPFADGLSRWQVTFETVGEQWIGITIPFIDGIPQEAVVDG